MQTTTEAGRLEIAEHEGLVPAPYLDSVGVWTWGLGHTAAAGGPDPSKMNKAMPNDLDASIDAILDQFRIDLAGYEARVRKYVTVDLKPYEFDSLVSFDFNTGGINRAVLTKAINSGDPKASQHFLGWLRPPEIRKRRTAEMRLFETGDYDANGDNIAIWKTNGAGRLTGVWKTISGGELLDRLNSKEPPHPDDLPQMVDVSAASLAIQSAALATKELTKYHEIIRDTLNKLEN